MAKYCGLNEEQLYTELYSAWLKDIHERAGTDTKKVFRDVVDRGFREKEIVLRKERVGVNLGIALSGLLARSSITKLDLYHNVLRDTGCEAVAHLLREAPNLAHLNLGANDIGLQGIQALSVAVAAHKKLQSLLLGTEEGDTYVNRIDPTCAKILLEGCCRSRTLKALDLSRNPIGKGSQEAFQLIQQLIYSSPTIQVVKLAQTNLGTESALLLATGLAKSGSMSYIDLSGNDLGSAVGEAIGKIIGDRSSRSTPSPLKTVILNDNPNIGERGSISLFRALAQDKGLTSLELNDCGVTDDALLVLCSSLLSNGALVELHLQSNSITEVGAVELARSLLRHPALSHLALAHNKLKDEGVCALASMLESNHIISHLDLEDSWIGDRGVVALGVALANNKTVSTLKINNNHISDDGGNAFVALLEKNRSLQNCSLKGNNVFHCTIMHAQKITNRNKQAKQDEVPSRLRKEVIKLHYQMYKLEEAKIELENQRQKKLEIDKTQEKFEAQFRQEEADFRKKQKDLLEQQQQLESQCTHFETQMKNIAENYERMLQQHELDMAAARERFEVEVKEREKAEEELKKVQHEAENAEAQREQRMEEMKKKIISAKEDREKWVAQTKEYKQQVDELQSKVREMEAKVAVINASAAAAVEPKPAPPPKPSGKKSGAADIDKLLAS